MTRWCAETTFGGICYKKRTSVVLVWETLGCIPQIPRPQRGRSDCNGSGCLRCAPSLPRCCSVVVTHPCPPNSLTMQATPTWQPRFHQALRSHGPLGLLQVFFISRFADVFFASFPRMFVHLAGGLQFLKQPLALRLPRAPKFPL